MNRNHIQFGKKPNRGEPYHPYLLKNRSAKSLEKLKSDPCLCSSKFKSLILIIITYIYSHYLFIYYILF